MPELPEIASRAAEMNHALAGKVINGIEVVQPKCLNLPADELRQNLLDAELQDTTYHGKWLQTRTTRGWILMNMGMGGEILLTNREQMPAKYRLIVDFADATCLAINFWWFGYVHFAPLDQIQDHSLTAKLGPNALDLSLDEFKGLLSNQKGRVKSFLLDQSKIAGVGNAYIHDILFLARLHPLRPLNTISADEISALHQAIHDGLVPSLQKGGAFYETNLYGQKGNFQMEDILIGYREGQPCPVCKTPIQKIKTGGTSSFICPTCQPDPSE